MVKVDLHIHSKYSNRPSEWFLNKLGARESYTEPETIYQMAKERGMTYVTVTDHNNIKGSVELNEKYKDAFTGVETTTYFPEDNCKIHLLIFGLNGEQFDEIQRIRRDIYQLREYVIEQKLAHSAAHATYSVNGKISIEHLEKLVLLFDVFEAINGGRNRTNNDTWHYYLKYLTKEKMDLLQEKHKIKLQRSNPWVKGFTGGSDDHAGIYVGHTYTLTGANSIPDFLSHIRNRKTFAEGRHNDYQSLAFTVYKVAHDYSRAHSQPLINMFPLGDLGELVFGERRVSLVDRLTLAVRQSNGNGYQNRITELIREISRQRITSIENNLDLLYSKIADITDEMFGNLFSSVESNLKKNDVFSVLGNISSAIPGIFLLVPFFTSLKHLNNNMKMLTELRESCPNSRERKILWFTDTLNDLNGVSITLKYLGWKFYSSGVDVKFVSSLLDEEISNDLPPNTINLPQVATFQLPYYEQYTIKIPSLLKSMKALHGFEPDEIFISTPGPIGMLGLLIGRLMSVPVTGIYHTDFTLELGEIARDESAVNTVESAVRWFYSLMDEIRVPTQSYIDILEKRGLDRSKMSIFPRHVDTDAFAYHPPWEWDGTRIDLDEGLNLLYVGRVSKDKNLEFLIDVYKELIERGYSINLIITGDGPFKGEMENELRQYDRVRFTGKVPYDTLPLIYSQADALIFPSITDTFGMVVLEAQCCELPAIVSDRGGPKELVKENETGLILPALNKEKWVEAILNFNELKNSKPEEYRQLRINARNHIIENLSWDNLLAQLTKGKNSAMNSEHAVDPRV